MNSLFICLSIKSYIHAIHYFLLKSLIFSNMSVRLRYPSLTVFPPPSLSLSLSLSVFPSSNLSLFLTRPSLSICHYPRLYHTISNFYDPHPEKESRTHCKEKKEKMLVPRIFSIFPYNFFHPVR